MRGRLDAERRSEDNNAGKGGERGGGDVIANRKGRMMKTVANVPAFDLQVQKT